MEVSDSSVPDFWANRRPGEEGTTIWDLETGERVGVPTGAADRGITTAVVFMTTKDEADDGVAYGTDDGYLCIWKRGSEEDNVSSGRCYHRAMLTIDDQIVRRSILFPTSRRERRSRNIVHRI